MTERGLEGSSNGRTRGCDGATEHLDHPAGGEAPPAHRGARRGRQQAQPASHHADTQNRSKYTRFIHIHTHTHPGPCPDLWHQRCQDTRLHVGSNQRRCQSTASTRRRSAHGSPPPPTRQKGRACCPSSVISSSLPACHLRSLGPVSLAPYPCQQPYGYHYPPRIPTMSSPRLLPHSSLPPTQHSPHQSLADSSKHTSAATG